jgi:hypothetical protein
VNAGQLQVGATYQVGADCGVPHGFRPILFRLGHVDEKPTYEHMSWLDGYELDEHGKAVEQRRIYVITAGLQLLAPPPPPVRRLSNAGPARIPRQRTAPVTTTSGRTR